MSSHRFRPRYRGVAWVAIAVGGSLVAVAATVGFVAVPIVTGALGVAAGLAYLGSPTWKLSVIADDDGLEVSSPKRRRFRIAWTDIVKVVASPTTHSCFVDGGAPERSLLVPGDGAPAPYDLVERKALFDAIIAHVAKDKVEIVETLEQEIAKANALAKAAAMKAHADAKAEAAKPKPESAP